MRIESRFKDKNILITGAASGFGRLLAERLAELGANLSLSDINHQTLEEVVAGPAFANTEVASFVCNVASASDVKTFVDGAVQELGSIDIAINNAGILTPTSKLVNTDESAFDSTFAVNTKGVFFCMKYEIPPMIANGGGAILNVASAAGLIAAPGLCAYGASKHAVVGLTRTAAIENAEHNVRVNAICPYFSATPLLDGKIADGRRGNLGAVSPMKRIATPEEIVAAMLLLTDPSNTYMNGQAIAIDGGLTAF